VKQPWIALALLSACASWAQSSSNSGAAASGPPKQSHVAKQARDSHYPTKDAPLPVTVLQSKGDAEHEEAREKTADEQFIKNLGSQLRVANASEKQARAALTAAIIVGVETVIAGVALFFLMKTYGETRRTAKAALLSARTARHGVKVAREAIEANRRPRLFVRELLQFPITSGDTLKIQFAIGNAGDAEGTISESFIDGQSSTFSAWRPVRPPAERNPIGPKPIKPGEQLYWDVDLKIGAATLMNIANAEVESERRARDVGPTVQLYPEPPTIIVNGFVIYTDSKGVRRKTAFLRRLNVRSLRFDRIEDPDYEYAD